MRIFFIGTVNFSAEALKKLLAMDVEIVGVATKSKSAFNADHVDLSFICEKANIPCKYVRDINAPHILEWIQSLNPDIVFCFGWSSLIKNDLLSLTKNGIIGFHPSELPYNRGRHPLIWALVLGLKQSATTFFFMEKGADDGDILSQKSLSISYEDNAASLYDKVISNALSQIEEFLPELENGNFNRLSQDLTKGNVWRKRGMTDGQIDFRMNSRAIYNLVRGLTKPYVGAHLFYREKEVKVWAVEEMDCDLINIEPGKVIENDNINIVVKTADAAIKIVDHTFDKLPKINEYL